MNSLRLEADEAAAKVQELQAKVKALEQENLAKEQEITSLQHKNNLLEGEVEKLEAATKDFKKAADEGQQHGTQNETLQRRLQLLEEEAEDADKTLREANEKYGISTLASCSPFPAAEMLRRFLVRAKSDANHYPNILGFDRPMSRLDTSSARCRLSNKNGTNGSRSTRRWQRSTRPCRRNWRSFKTRLATSNFTSL